MSMYMNKQFFLTAGYDGYMNFLETGFGNRFIGWQFINNLNQRYDNYFTLLVFYPCWREIDYMNFPNTISTKDLGWFKDVIEPAGHLHYFDSVQELYGHNFEFREFDEIDDLDRNKSHQFHTKDYTTWFPDIEGDTHFPTLKNEKLEKKIKEVVKDRVGLHIRAVTNKTGEPHKSLEWNGAEKILNKMKFFKEKYGFEKFYLSSDAELQSLPQHKHSNFYLIDRLYDMYDIVDYTDIWNPEQSDNRDGYLVYNYEEPIFTTRLKSFKGYGLMWDYGYSDLVYPDKRTLKDVIDLFALVYSKSLIGSNSTWTKFAHDYRTYLKMDGGVTWEQVN